MLQQALETKNQCGRVLEKEEQLEMRKRIAMILAAVLLIGSLGGCASSKSSSENEEGSSSKDTLKVAMDLKFPPFPERMRMESRKAGSRYCLCIGRISGPGY